MRFDKALLPNVVVADSAEAEHGIYPVVFVPKLKVQVVSGCGSRHSDMSDNVALLHHVALLNINR